jgi:glycosyltransferase involved in cell wall biosynthesis
MDTPKITIGICVKDSGRTIKGCLESIINQDYPSGFVQVVISDGCSKDNTISLIGKISKKNNLTPEIFSDKGAGLGVARQIIVNNALGKYIIFVDADIRLPSDFIRLQVNYIDSRPNLSVAFGKQTFQQGTTFATVWSMCKYVVGEDIGTGASIFRTETLRKIGGFDTNIKGAAEDLDIIFRLKSKGWRCELNENARFFHQPRQDLRSFWIERTWFGYGDHYFYHKHGSLDPFWHRFPAGQFILGLKYSSKAYRQTRKKLSFLIVPQILLANISWWTGFVKGHLDGYGHEK